MESPEGPLKLTWSGVITLTLFIAVVTCLKDIAVMYLRGDQTVLDFFGRAVSKLTVYGSITAALVAALLISLTVYQRSRKAKRNN